MIQVQKRSKKIVRFERGKITKAITKAMAESPEGIDEDLARNISRDVEKKIIKKEKMLVDIEEIQDYVEIELMKTRPEVAKLYILYREERNKLRKKGWDMTDLQKDIYEQKYRFNKESFEEFVNRISGDNDFIAKAIIDKKFLPAGRILAGRGLENHGRKITLSNCYVMPKVEDNIESIFDTAKWLARTYSYGGGCGLTLSKLRPKGSKVNNAANTTTGAVSFMELFSMVTGLIGMRGRRGALMLNLDVNHPDILDFINVKNDLEKVTSANISVNVNNDFMKAVENDEEYELHFDVEATGEKIRKKIKARKLFTTLAKNNWDFAEPGILYQDRINSWHIMSEDENFEFAGVNPCAEETLPAFGSCNLSSINLSEFVINPFTEEAEFDSQGFREMVWESVKYLNEILDENMELHPLPEQREMSKNYRQIGLGVMGVADMFIKLGVRYGSTESLKVIDKIGKILINDALCQSALLAKKDGPFPKFKKDKVLKSEFLINNADESILKLIEEYGLRNSQLLTIPPTGSTSTLLGCSNGLEPIYQISYTRKTESLYGVDSYYKVYTPVVKEYMEYHKIEKEEDLPEHIVTAFDLTYEERINVQAKWQEYIDASISSTVNVPNDFTVEEVEKLYMYAWEKGVKGITIYRDGCARTGILTSNKTDSKLDKIQELQEEINKIAEEYIEENPNSCPMCGGDLKHTGGCAECKTCGYSPCSV